MLVVNCKRILNKILNSEQRFEIVNSDINVGLNSFVESGIDLIGVELTVCLLLLRIIVLCPLLLNQL